MDGGRILLGSLVDPNHSFAVATERTAQMSKQISSGMMAIGILGIIFQYQTLWFAIIGGILRMIAETAYRTVQQSEQLTRPLQEVMIPRDRMVTLAHDTPPTRAARPVSSLRVPSLPHRRTREITGLVYYKDVRTDPKWFRSERNDHHPVHSQLVLRSNRAPGSHFTTGARCDAPQRFGSAVGVCGWDVSEW